MAAPGRYTARLTIANADAATQRWSMSQPFVVRADPRQLKDGVTPAVMRAQLAHNLKVRDMVSETNRLVARMRAARTRFAGAAQQDSLRLLQAIEGKLLTPTVRYSRPGLQAHINYLYGMTMQADQRVPRDAVERFQALRRELDAVQAEARRLLGPERETTASTGS